MVQLRLLSIALAGAACLAGADPTFLRRSLTGGPVKVDELTDGVQRASYRPLFGKGDPDAGQLKGIARYGLLSLEPGGASAVVSYPAEEQIYYVLRGKATLVYGEQTAPVTTGDFMYLPPGVKHGLSGVRDEGAQVLVMGFRIPAGVKVGAAAKPQIANVTEVPLTTLAGHGPTAQFKLLMGTTDSKRDRLAAASQMVSLFIMDFAPGGTNIPHHHEMEEEIYFLLQGRGEMVAGGGADGNEGRYPAQAGDVFFIRLNATVGFYSGARDGEPHDQVLAVRSRFPFSR